MIYMRYKFVSIQPMRTGENGMPPVNARGMAIDRFDNDDCRQCRGLAPVRASAADESGGATVLTLNPAFVPLPSNWLRSELFTAPNVRVKVPYTNLPNAYSWAEA